MRLKLLRAFTLFGCFLYLSGNILGQNCVVTGLNNTSIASSCSQSCRDLNFQIPDIRGTSTYTVISIPYTPYPYITAGSTEDLRLYNDDNYSAVFNLPFPFCFYDSVYAKAVVSSNGLVTFDTTNASCLNGSAAYFVDTTIPYSDPLRCNPFDFPRASIMAAFMDLDPRPGPLDPTFSSPPDRKIEWRVEGTAPCRRFVVSFYHIGAFAQTPCGQDPAFAATFQIVMYESTGLIDIFIQNKICNSVEPGARKAILGVQNFSRTEAVAAPGKNATVWTAFLEGYRFVPSGGASRFVSSELLTMDLSHIAWSNSSSSTPGLLDINFPGICSPAASTRYIVKTIFSACDDPAVQLISMDTITVNLTVSLNATATTTHTDCGPPSGTITVNVPAAGVPPFSYMLDSGVPVVSSAFDYTFTNVAGGLHTVSVTDASNCSTNNIPVSVQTPDVLTTTVNKTDVLCNGGSTGTIIVTQPTSGTGTFQYSLDGIAWQDDNSFNGLVARTYTVYYRDSRGCQGSQSVIINEPTELVATVSTLAAVCNGQDNGTIRVETVGGTSPYQYSIDDGTTWQDGNTFLVPAGTYNITIRDNNNCTTIQSATVTEPPLLVASSANTNASCDGGNDGKIIITASGGSAGYQYSLDGTTFQSSNIFNTGPGNYNVTVKDNLGCTVTFNTTVDLNNLTLSAQTDTAICEGESVQLQLNSNATQYVWTPIATLNDPHIPNPVATPAVTTEYMVTATLGRCIATAAVVVKINKAPVPNAGTDGLVCEGQSHQLQGSGGTSFNWTPSTYLNNTTISNPVSSPDKTIVYNLSVVDANGCHSLAPDDVIVTVSPPVHMITTPPDTIAYRGDRLELTAIAGAGSYTWVPASGLSDPNIPNPIVTVGAVGDDVIYHVTASTSSGCKAEGSVRIRVYNGPDIYMPTAFTPNNDGKNDKFTPIPVGIKKINYFKVFNRWGQMVFSSNTLHDGWDGKFGSKEQPGDVYVWIVQGITRDNKVVTKKGTVMLIK